MSDQPKPTTGEWTVEFAGGDAWRIDGSPCAYGYSKQQAIEICNAHNAALADERETARQIKTAWDDICIKHGQLQHDLATEREKREAAEQRAAAYHRQIGDENKMTEQLLAAEREKRMTPRDLELSREIQQLRSQLAEVEEHNIRGAIHPDVLARRIAEAQQPLVDALAKTRDLIDSYNSTDKSAVDFLSDIEIIVYAALENVKEGK